MPLDDALVHLDKVPCYCWILEIKLLVCFPKLFFARMQGRVFFRIDKARVEKECKQILQVDLAVNMRC